jgi:hypothetical protein
MKKVLRWMGIAADVLLAVAAVIVIALYVNLAMIARANADGAEGRAWVMCRQVGYVNIRTKPKKTAEAFGGAEAGTLLMTDGRSRGGFLHVVDLAAEESDGWISEKYVVWDEPEEINRRMVIRAQGRVACRKWIGGKIIKWLQEGDEVTVYWRSREWSVTDKGYIMTAFLAEA